MNIEQTIAAYGLMAIFVIVLLKEFGIPVPIPGDLIMLGTAVQAARGQFNPVLAFVAIFVPMLIGGMVQYAIARGPGRSFIYRIGKHIGLTQERLDKMMERVRRGGSAAVAIGLTTPGVRIATTPASGLANLEPARFGLGLIAGSALFLGWHFALGYAGGAAIQSLQLPAPALVAIVFIVLVFGLIAAAVRYYRVKRIRPSLAESYVVWADACCPVCAAVTLAQAVHETPSQQAQVHVSI